MSSTAAVDGGAGGKFRKRPFRRAAQSTPYDRPINSIRNPSSLISKLVDPASKLIFAGANRLFGVFRKRITLPNYPPRSTETSQEPSNRIQYPALINSAASPETRIDQGWNLVSASDASEVTELEQMLRQKTFTRSEVEHLTALLQSRTSDLPARNDDQLVESKIPKTSFGAFTNKPENIITDRVDNVQATVSTSLVSSKVLEENIASPAELAKAYMGRQPSQVSPSVLGMRSRALRQESALLKDETLLPKTPIMTLTSKPLIENGFTTPRLRGRSAIYSMARTPYSRVHLSVNSQGNKPIDGFAVPLSSLTAWDHEKPSSSKQMALKRRSSVLEEDIGPVNSIRRIRQKPNLLSLGSSLSTHVREPSSQKLNEPPIKVSRTVAGNGDTSIASPSYAGVPKKSSETAAKILQHLEMLSPKDKSLESRIGSTREKSPAKLTPNMLHGKALKSLEKVEPLTFPPSAQDNHKSEVRHDTFLSDVRNSTLKQKEILEDWGRKNYVVPHIISTSASGDSSTSVKAADSVIESVSEPPQKKRAFIISALEDYLEIDEDNINGSMSTPLDSTGKPEASDVNKVLSTEALPVVAKLPALPEEVKTLAQSEVKASASSEIVQNPAISEPRNPVDSVPQLKTDFGNSSKTVVGEVNIGFSFSKSNPPSFNSQSPVLSQSTSAVAETVPLKESNDSKLFAVLSKDAEKHSPFAFHGSEGHQQKLPSDPRPDSFDGPVNVDSAKNDVHLKISLPDKGDKNANEAADNAPAATSSGIFSFGIRAKNSNLNNGSLASTSPSLISPSAPVLSANSASQPLNNSVSSPPVAFTISADATPSAPNFSFGSSAMSTSVSTVPTTETMDKKVKGDNENKSGITSFSGTLFSNTGNIPFVFGTSSSSTSTSDNQPQGSPFSGSMGNLQSTAATQSSIFQFGTSAPVSASSASTQSTSAPTFETSASTQSSVFQFGSSSSLSSGTSGSMQSSVFQFGSTSSPVSGTSASLQGSAFQFVSTTSSIPGTSSPFGSTPSFGLSPAVSSSGSAPANSTSGATTSGVFGTNWDSSKPSIFGSNNFSSPSTGFPFGAGVSSFPTTSSVPGSVFGTSNISSVSSSPSMFSFSTPAATTPTFPSLSQTQSVFGSSTPVFGNNNHNDQMSMEDSMAEDSSQFATTPPGPSFGQPSSSPGLMFGQTNPTPSALPFQFAGQPSQPPAQNLSTFQGSSSLDFAGGSFSLGTADKSGRKILRVSNKNRNRKREK